LLDRIRSALRARKGPIHVARNRARPRRRTCHRCSRLSGNRGRIARVGLHRARRMGRRTRHPLERPRSRPGGSRKRR
jgi:hypothetical protein